MSYQTKTARMLIAPENAEVVGVLIGYQQEPAGWINAKVARRPPAGAFMTNCG